MKIKIEITDTFSCSVESAFKAPILGNATKFLNGYLFQPPVIGFEEDKTWGEVDGIRYPVVNGNIFVPKGRIFTDRILEKVTNKMWKWKIYDFKIPAMFFADKAIGKWYVKPITRNNISVRYSYTFYSKNIFFHLFTVLFAYIQWKGMMKKAIKGIKLEAEELDNQIETKLSLYG